MISQPSENNNENEVARSLGEGSQRAQVIGLSKPPSPFPLAVSYLREFLELVEAGRVDTLTIIGMGNGDLAPKMRICIRKDLPMQTAQYRMMLSSEALETKVHDLITPNLT